jgi:hypothetical protein
MDAHGSAQQEQQHPRASARLGGAVFLDEACGPDVVVLHDVAVGGVEIDHLAFTPSGIYVIDEKHYENAKVEIRRARGIFSSCLEHLYVKGCDATSFLDGSDRKVAAVREALADVPGAADVPVRGVLCFIAARLPVRGPRELRGVSVLGPRLTAGLLGTVGSISLAARRELYSALTQRLPAAA